MKSVERIRNIGGRRITRERDPIERIISIDRAAHLCIASRVRLICTMSDGESQSVPPTKDR
ncbi:MAG TPA: hypothetical protein VKB76_18780, partial [Ktedonobacterales bacterium]|nr:hypothetical protein [Ktedonobacterales bacterium]